MSHSSISIVSNATQTAAAVGSPFDDCRDHSATVSQFVVVAHCSHPILGRISAGTKLYSLASSISPRGELVGFLRACFNVWKVS